MARWEDTCKHGAEGFCMLCCREGENKPTSSGEEEDTSQHPKFPGDYEKQWWED